MPQPIPDNRLPWIDLLRGLCMMAILWDHTELYYADDNIIPYGMYVVNALVIFFFISGYLLYKPQGFFLHHRLSSILRGMVWPYFVFTSIIALPKAWAHGFDLHDIFISILWGNASGLSLPSSRPKSY